MRDLEQVRLGSMALGVLLLFSTCFPKGERNFYTCKACFVDNPTWCMVHEDGHGDFPAEDERQAKEFAKAALCSDYEKKKPKEKKAYLQCALRPANDFIVTCTSTVRVATLHAYGCTNLQSTR
jgi:hypothetical protein